MQQKTAIKTATKYIQKAYKGDKNIIRAYLFGSYARNEQKTWSDIDVCIVHKGLSKDPNEKALYYWQIKNYDDEKESKIEPIVIDKKNFRDGIPLPYIIKREGILLPLD